MNVVPFAVANVKVTERSGGFDAAEEHRAGRIATFHRKQTHRKSQRTLYALYGEQQTVKHKITWKKVNTRRDRSRRSEFIFESAGGACCPDPIGRYKRSWWQYHRNGQFNHRKPVECSATFCGARKLEKVIKSSQSHLGSRVMCARKGEGAGGEMRASGS